MQFQSYTFTSKANLHIHYDVYTPSITIRPRGIIQIHHSFNEGIKEYQRFADYLSMQGYIVVVSELPGHGQSLYKGIRGNLGDGDNIEKVIEDMQQLRMIISSRYPELPYFIIGCKVSSIILRKYIVKYGRFLEGIILLSPCDNVFMNKKIEIYTKMSYKIKGKAHRSLALYQMTKQLTNYSSIGLDENIHQAIDRMQEISSYCIYPNSTIKAIVDVTKDIQKSKLINMTPKELAVLVISSKPECNFDTSCSSYKVFQKYTNIVDDICKLEYKTCFDNVLFEKNNIEIFNDISNWLNKHTVYNVPL